MTDKIEINVENKLITEKRDMNVYSHSTNSAHLISYGSSIPLPLEPDVDDDYLHISIVSGPGQLELTSVVDLPSWANFEFSSEGKLTVIRSGDRTLLKIPPGLPLWQLKMTRSISSLKRRLSVHKDRLIVRDGQPGYL